MYSAGMNNYLRFAEGTEFKGIKEDIKILDIEVPVNQKIILQQAQWKRSSIIKNQIIEAENY